MVEARHLVEGGRLPLGRRSRLGSAPDARRRLTEEIEVGADDGQRRPQLVGDDGQQLGPGGVERRQLDEPALDLGLETTLLDDPGEQRADRPEQLMSSLDVRRSRV